MGMTMTQKILAKHSGHDCVSVGDLLISQVDLILANDITGPVGLPKLIGQAYEASGYIALLNIFILLSINIGLMNLLPIPALDGGRLLFVIPEFFGIKINKKIEEKLHLVGMIVLFTLMIFIVFNDMTKYFK